MKHALLVVVASIAFATPDVHAQAPRFEQRWFYAAFNLQVEKNADELIALIARASKAGYNGMVLADYKLNILDRVPAHYFRNMARVQKAARAAGVEIIPAVFPIGYSAGLLAHDPNLAEGLPVRDAPFAVAGRRASLSDRGFVGYVNGDLENTKGDRFPGMRFQDDPGKKTFADRKTVRSGKVSCRMENFTVGEAANARIMQQVKVRPHACYRFSCWVKTRDLNPAGNFRLLALGKSDRALSFQEGERQSTQDWSQVDIIFNSLEETEVSLYAGVWGGRSGTLWIDGLKLEELALVNVLRRPGCPFVVQSADGKTTYTEGKDFEPVRDEKLGQDPDAGEYGFAHTGAELRLTAGSRIRDGDRLRVSWYHPIKTHSYQVMCCLSEPALYEVLRRQVERVHKLLEPRRWFFSHDEIRVAGWCRSCRDSGKTPGGLLATNVSRCADIIRRIDPKARMIVWSDMFDPNHNARDRYYLVNGSLKESWRGLPSEMWIANWNGGKAAASLKWFANRGHSQVIAGYYDGGMEGFRRWTTAAQGIKAVSGFMYTTWRRDYRLLEAYGKAMQGR